MTAANASSNFIEETVEISGPNGPLEGVLSYPELGRPERAAAIAGPHPFLGGNINNFVATTIAETGAARGWVTLRFAYAQAGRFGAAELDEFWKTGHAPSDRSCLDDLRAAVELSQELAPLKALIGYSFGCWLASLFVAADDVRLPLALVSPTVTQHDFSTLREWRGPKFVVASDNDFATPLKALEDEVEHWPEPKELQVAAGAEHFYQKQAGAIAEDIFNWLDRTRP